MQQLTSEQVAAGYRPVHTKDDRGMDDAWAMYERVILAVLLKMLERAERDPAYGFLDMKVDLISGNDFPEDDPLRGKGTIYAWIQGRGLEALAGHSRWLKELTNSRVDELTNEARAAVVERIERVTRRLMDRMEELRAAAGGRLSFMMRANGEKLAMREGRLVPKQANVGAPLPSNFSDLFYGKGLAAAAAILGDEKRLKDAEEILWRVVRDVESGKFESDQEQFDNRNPVGNVPGRIGHGPKMILIGAAALMYELIEDTDWLHTGDDMVELIMRGHVNGGTDQSRRQNSGRASNLEVGIEQTDGRPSDLSDMWEFVDLNGRAYMEEGKLRSDPGHATEFAGLALKFLRIQKEQGVICGPDPEWNWRWRAFLNNVLQKNFGNGFSAKGIGICKAYDLVGRKAMNSDMPWWNLPETMRAGMEAAACARDDHERQAFLQIVRQCSNAFMTYFIRPDRWLMANQTVDENGNVANRVPATPDADPGYHTGLSLIDCLRLHHAT